MYMRAKKKLVVPMDRLNTIIAGLGKQHPHITYTLWHNGELLASQTA